MQIRIDTPLGASHLRVTAVFSKTQRIVLKRAGGVLQIAFPDISFSDRNSSSRARLVNSRWTMRPARSLKTVAARGVGHSLAERPYSSCREVTRTPGGSCFPVVDDDHTLPHCDAVGRQPPTASKATFFLLMISPEIFPCSAN